MGTWHLSVRFECNGSAVSPRLIRQSVATATPGQTTREDSPGAAVIPPRALFGVLKVMDRQHASNPEIAVGLAEIRRLPADWPRVARITDAFGMGVAFLLTLSDRPYPAIGRTQNWGRRIGDAGHRRSIDGLKLSSESDVVGRDARPTVARLMIRMQHDGPDADTR